MLPYASYAFTHFPLKNKKNKRLYGGGGRGRLQLWPVTAFPFLFMFKLLEFSFLILETPGCFYDLYISVSFVSLFFFFLFFFFFFSRSILCVCAVFVFAVVVGGGGGGGFVCLFVVCCCCVVLFCCLVCTKFKVIVDSKRNCLIVVISL